MAILLLLLFLPFLFSLMMKKIRNSKQNLPPGPAKLPIIGNLHQLKGMLHRCLYDLSKKHGPVMHLRLGFVPMVLLSSSEAAEEALKTHDLECCTRPNTNATRVFSRNNKNIGLGAYGDAWRELRKLSVREYFSVKKVQSFRYVREEETELMVKKLRELALKQSPVDLSKTLFCLAASIVFRPVFGQSFLENKHFSEDKIEELVFEAQRSLTFKVSDLFPIPGLGWFIGFVSGQHKRLNNVFTEVDTFLNYIIDDHQLQITNQDHPDIVDTLLQMIHKQEHDKSFKLTIDHLKGISQDIFLAGIDTSAITMIWAMAELVRNPRVMKKAQDEIRNCIGIKARIEDEDVNKLQYLKLVIKETLRLHPAAPLLLPRETMADIKIQGYDIPRKTLLLVNAWSIGRDPKYWKNPEEFNPERFIDCPVDYKGQNFEFIPFGSGRRICPGMASGLATIELALLNLLNFFDWKLPDEKKDMDMEESGDVTVVKKVPLELLPILRH
ncbi:PREDICTED: cytochrome P450 71B25-like [Camelina sativa]|uniref:Cytochrome P450 71B25-like n=1 Tax=Camelina sativa TaxID=90675 RepID=A0ABM0ZDK9_CAMSA|nr:PREDICTED: cytochrome P450 71B25-like [Camelina sativa]